MELKHNLIECEDYKQMAQYFTKCVCGLRCKGVRIWMNQDLVEESLSDSMGEASYITDGYPDTMHVICEKGMEQEYSLYVYATLVSDGALAGSVTNLADCMRTVVKKMEIPLETAVACATINPAKSLGIEDTYGSIAPGKKANIVLLDENLELKMVIKDGQEL